MIKNRSGKEKQKWFPLFPCCRVNRQSLQNKTQIEKQILHACSIYV